eukprot:scaffold38695_cov155-Skeletonema_dohrnii-CCMP3373.AAC.1
MENSPSQSSSTTQHTKRRIQNNLLFKKLIHRHKLDNTHDVTSTVLLLSSLLLLMNLIQLSLYYYSSSIIAACNDQLLYDQSPCAPIINSWSSLTTSLLLQSLQYSSTAPSRIAASSRGYWFASAFTAPPSIIHHAGSNNKILHFKHHPSQRARSRMGRLFETENVDNNSQKLDSDTIQPRPLNNEEEEEREKLNYLALAKEAHSKFFVDQISQEEYVNLALSAWNDAYSSNDGDDDEGVNSNNELYQSQSSPPILKGASSSVTTNNYYSAATTTNVNKLQSNQPSGAGDVSKLKSTSPFVVGKKGINNSSGGNKLDQASFATKKTKQLQQQPLIARDNSQFSAVQQQQQQNKFGTTSTNAFGKNKFASSKVSIGSNDGTKSSSPMDAQPSSFSLDPSSMSMKSNVLKQPTPMKGVSKIAASKGGEFNSAFSKVPSSTSMPLSSSSPPPPPLKGSSAKISFSKESSPPPPPSTNNNNNNGNSNSSSKNSSNPFDLFGGLGAKLFGKSKRPTPSTSLIGGMGMLNEVEESNVPYGLRVGKKAVGGGYVVKSGLVVEGASSSSGGNGGGVDRVVGKGSMPSPGVMSKKKQQIMMKREKLKGATSFGGNASISSSSTVGQSTKKVVMKGGEFQPSLTKQVINTPTNPATFQKGTLGNKIGKGVLPTKKLSTPIKKMSTFVNKAPLQQQPQPISNEANAVQSPSSS